MLVYSRRFWNRLLPGTSVMHSMIMIPHTTDRNATPKSAIVGSTHPASWKTDGRTTIEPPVTLLMRRATLPTSVIVFFFTARHREDAREEAPASAS
jgi:hypothetical protein